MLTGDEAKEAAKPLVKLYAIVNADKLNVRQDPSAESPAVGYVVQNERYPVISETDGWVEINSGYISADYVDVKLALDEAKKLDLKSMVFNMYDNLGISSVDTYLNIREEPSENATIIGKMTSKSAGDILETVDGWYKIKSGPVTGYGRRFPAMSAMRCCSSWTAGWRSSWIPARPLFPLTMWMCAMRFRRL